MILIDIIKTEKVLHRKQIDLKIVIHDSNIEKIELLNDEKQKTFLKDIIKYNINSELKNNHFNIIRTFWIEIFKNLPKVSTDGRIKVGEYKLFSNVNLLVRSSKLFKEQIIEIIINE